MRTRARAHACAALAQLVRMPVVGLVRGVTRAVVALRGGAGGAQGGAADSARQSAGGGEGGAAGEAARAMEGASAPPLPERCVRMENNAYTTRSPERHPPPPKPSAAVCAGAAVVGQCRGLTSRAAWHGLLPRH